MKQLINFLIVALLPLLSNAQNNYNEAILQGDEAFKNGKYKAAINKYFAAEAFDPSKKENVKVKVNAVFDKIEALRKEADNANNKAQKALTQLKAEQIKTERALIEAENARKSAEESYKRATQANEQVASSFIREANSAIKNMDYELALNKISTIAGLEVNKQDVLKSYMEIVFWHCETGNPQRGFSILDTALMMMGRNILSNNLDKLSNTDQLRHVLEQLDMNHYSFLKQRYYPHMIFIEGSTFQMGCDAGSLQKSGLDFECGSEQKQHSVILDNYYLAETETTWWQFGLYRAANGKNVWHNRAIWLPTGDHPVVNINWRDAIGYANWVSKQFKEFEKDTVFSGDLQSDQVEADWTKTGFRLPTEAEWEYAARSRGKDYIFAWGNSKIPIGNIADETAKASNPSWDIWIGYTDGYVYTSHVNRFQQGDLGLYDMTGNVWEWCWDWFDENYYEDNQKNPHGPNKSSSERSVRGGSWHFDPPDLRCTLRAMIYPDYYMDNLGFRLARAAK